MLLVHTMGRVGSSSVFHSLRAAGLPDVHHTHLLNPATIASAGARAGSVASMARSAQEAVDVATLLMRNPGRIKIVTLVRDAAERNLSAAFASIRRREDPAAVAQWLSEPDQVREWWKDFSDTLPFVWFERELEQPFGLDVYQHPFPDEGWCVLKNERADLLVMRAELDDARKSAALEVHLEQEIPITRANVGSRSPQWRELYSEFRRTVGASAYADELQKTDYQQHFYGSA